MNMEHIIQFAVGIDEDAIVKHATEMAAESILDKVRGTLREYTQKTYYTESRVDCIFREEVLKYIEENKEKIIPAAVNAVYASLTRTKAAKDATAKMLEEAANA